MAGLCGDTVTCDSHHSSCVDSVRNGCLPCLAFSPLVLSLGTAAPSTWRTERREPHPQRKGGCRRVFRLASGAKRMGSARPVSTSPKGTARCAAQASTIWPQSAGSRNTHILCTQHPPHTDYIYTTPKGAHTQVEHIHNCTAMHTSTRVLSHPHVFSACTFAGSS